MNTMLLVFGLSTIPAKRSWNGNGNVSIYSHLPFISSVLGEIDASPNVVFWAVRYLEVIF